MDDQASGWAEDDGAEVRYVVEPECIDPDKHVVRTGVRYVGPNRRLRRLAGEFQAMVRRVSGSDAAVAWSEPDSDGRSGDVYAKVPEEALEAFMDYIEAMERHTCERGPRVRGRVA